MKTGVNLIGFLTGNLGLGMAGRITASILDKKNIPFRIMNITMGPEHPSDDMTYSMHIAGADEVLPHDISIYHMNPPEIKALLQMDLPGLRYSETMNICVPFWELPKLPDQWRSILRKMDMILAPSHFIVNAVSNSVDLVPCRHYPQRMMDPGPISGDRGRWGFAGKKVVFINSFDVSSDILRKNPFGLLAAYQTAFQGAEDVLLAIKLNFKTTDPGCAKIAGDLKDTFQRIPGVKVFDQFMAFPEVQSLYASADVYVSPHRSEGLGLSLMECMFLGKPVIATAWSGNMDFMDDMNSCLMRYKLVPLHKESSYHEIAGDGQFWADPVMEDAVAWMRKLAGDAGLRRSIGARARKSIEAVIARADEGRIFHEIEKQFEIWRERKSIAAPYLVSVEADLEPKVARPASPPPEDQMHVHKMHAHTQAPGALRVLWQNRNDSDTLPGGDTTVLKETVSNLRALGVAAVVSLEDAPDLSACQIVHLNNISRTRDTLAQARNAKRQGRPSFLTPLYEDMDRYLIPATKMDMLYQRLVALKTRLSLEDMALVLNRFELPQHPLDNPTARYLGIGDRENQKEILATVDFVLTSGEEESRSITEKFGPIRNLETVRFGFNRQFLDADGKAFTDKYGLRDFVLCVGRLESRKNQWSLIEIFRTLPKMKLVLIGAFSNPTMERAVKEYAPPNVVFLERLPFAELVSAFGAARLHVLASWYELPGLVSLEAAAAGCRIVSTSWGSARDYFQDRVRYCEPDNFQSIRKAILEGYDDPAPSGLKAFVEETYGWDKTAARLREIYRRVLAGRR